MRPVVRAAFVPFSAPLEGVCRHLYLDVKGLVTTAIGVLVDPMSMALGLPFRRPDGGLASRAEIAAEWERVKARSDLRYRGGMVYTTITTLRLDDAGVAQTVSSKLNEMDRYLTERFADYPTWPADAQLATLSIAWACGPAFSFPVLERALRGWDFRTAADECRISTTGNPGVIPRNAANRLMFSNASVSSDPDVLFYPVDLLAGPVDRDAATEPDLDPPARPSTLQTRTVVDWPIIHPLRYELPDEPDDAA